MNSTPDPIVTSQLGDSLLRLVRTIGVPLVEVTPLRGPGYPGYEPNSFRIDFADGRSLKGRRCGNARRAELVESVLRHLDHPALPKAVARSGEALLVEWAEGRPLDGPDCTPDLLSSCGALQGYMHSVPIPRQHPFAGDVTMAARIEKLEQDLTALAAGRVLDDDEARRARELAVRCAPQHPDVGFVHRDFCAENLVLTPAGDIRVVDNEALAVDACDYDLGRTWHRWPMRRPQREAYFDGYARHRSPADFVRHFPFWAIVAVAGAASFRLKIHPAGALAPASKLRALLHALECGAADDAIFQW
jgi:phosphotransferase family enzyme